MTDSVPDPVDPVAQAIWADPDMPAENRAHAFHAINALRRPREGDQPAPRPVEPRAQRCPGCGYVVCCGPSCPLRGGQRVGPPVARRDATPLPAADRLVLAEAEAAYHRDVAGRALDAAEHLRHRNAT